MENRFIDMNLLLKGKAGRNGQQQIRNGSAAYSQSQSNGYSRQFGTVNYTVPGLVSPLRQKDDNACWATVATMMIMWKRQASVTVENAIASIGKTYLNILKADTGLFPSDKIQFLKDAGFTFEYPSSFSVEGLEGLLRTYGPIWVTTDENPGIHARIIIAISGDGEPDGTSLTIIDPAQGNQYQEKFSDFFVKYEREVRESGVGWSGRIQIVHWPAGVSVAKSFSNERTHSWMISQRGIDLIKSFEGFRANKYNDPVGHCTIGYGTLLHKGNCNGDASEQTYANGITEEQATSLLVDKLNEFQKTLNDSVTGVTVELNQNQYDSLVSFIYNVGSTNFRQSTLLRLLNLGNYAAVPIELRKWTKATQNGKLVELPGLVKRRNAEAELFAATTVAAAQSLVSSVNIARSFSSGPPQSLSSYSYTYQFSNDIPLSPANGGRSIMASALEMGDIILSTTNQIPSGLIRFGTRAPVSHTILYVGDGEQVVEAIGSGVTFRPLADALADSSFAVALRYPDLTQQQKLMIRDFAGQQIGKPYNTVGVVRNGVFQMDRSSCEPLRIISESSFQSCERWKGKIEMGTGSGDSYFCSELIVAAFNYAGVPLTATPPNWSSPGDLANLEFRMLNYVGHLKTA